MSTETLTGTGVNVFTSGVRAVGMIRFLGSSEEVLGFVGGPDVAETVVPCKAWPILTGGKAAEVLTPMLLFRRSFPPVLKEPRQA